MLDAVPDNADYATTNKVVYDGHVRARGINWTNADHHTFATPVSDWAGREFQTLFDDQSEELSIDGDWEEPGLPE
jgi:hypothetical protein